MLRTSISVLPGKRLKDFFLIPNASAGNEDLELRVERACSKLYCGPQSVRTVDPNTGQGLAILIPAILFLNPGKRRQSAFKAATTTTVPNRDALYPTMPHPALHKHSTDTRGKITE